MSLDPRPLFREIGMSKYSCSEEYFDDYGVSEGFCFQKADEIVEYIREQRLRAPSNAIPDELLSWWQFAQLPEPQVLDRMEKVEKHRREMCCWLIFGQMLESVRLIYLLLTHRELLGTWEENAALCWSGRPFCCATSASPAARVGRFPTSICWRSTGWPRPSRRSAATRCWTDSRRRNSPGPGDFRREKAKTLGRSEFYSYFCRL